MATVVVVMPCLATPTGYGGSGQAGGYSMPIGYGAVGVQQLMSSGYGGGFGK